MRHIDPWKFVKKAEKGELHPELTGLGYKNGDLYATDAIVMFRQKVQYPQKYEGKVVSKEGKVLTDKPPKYASVIPDMGLYRPWRIDIGRLKLTIKRGTEHNDRIKKMPRYERTFEPEILFVAFYARDVRNVRQKVITVSLQYAKKLLYYLEKTGTETIWTKTEGSWNRPLIAQHEDTLLMLMPVLSENENQEVSCPLSPYVKQPKWIKPETEKKSEPKLTTTTKKPHTMTKRKTTNKKSTATVRMASRILHEQKADYQKIFRAEVKKSKDPKIGAKKAGKIYRDRYGATAKARWKKALKRAK